MDKEYKSNAKSTRKVKPKLRAGKNKGGCLVGKKEMAGGCKVGRKGVNAKAKAPAKQKKAKAPVKPKKKVGAKVINKPSSGIAKIPPKEAKPKAKPKFTSQENIEMAERANADRRKKEKAKTMADFKPSQKYKFDLNTTTNPGAIDKAHLQDLKEKLAFQKKHNITGELRKNLLKRIQMKKDIIATKKIAARKPKPKNYSKGLLYGSRGKDYSGN